jgi:signal transduction histidine kinase
MAALSPVLPPSTGPVADEATWVKGELIRHLMSTSHTTRYVNLFLIPVFFAIGYGHVPAGWLTLWCLGAAVLWFGRRRVALHYERAVARADTAAQLAFMRRYGFVWPLGGFWWGTITLLFFDRTPLINQFICWLIIGGTGSFALNTFSSYLPVLRGYVGALTLTVVGVITLRMLQLGTDVPIYHYWILVLALIHWQLLLRTGLRLHDTHRSNFELLYRNHLLIQSLTRQTQAALDAVAVKNRFLANATHDIRQPVHALALYADWLSSEPDLVREIAPKIVESTRAVNRLFDSLFDLARLDAGQVRVSIEVIDVPQLLRELELQYGPLAHARGLQLRLRSVPGVMVSDPVRIKRILGNLISNAIKYTRKGGVLVAARPLDNGMRMEVWDTGVGIAPQHLEEIFREFYKVPAHAGTEDGFGLGLAIVSRLAGAMGHRIEVKSRPGRGSVFKLTVEGVDEEQVNARIAASMASVQAARAQLDSRPWLRA